jgi:hypothetical protein
LRTVLAYLDAGSGSMILQLLLGGVAAIGVALKMYWRRFLKLLGIRKEDDYADETPATVTEAEGGQITAERQKVESPS